MEQIICNHDIGSMVGSMKATILKLEWNDLFSFMKTIKNELCPA